LCIDDEDSDMVDGDSDEEQDQIMDTNFGNQLSSPAVSAYSTDSFRQLDYLWLFDPYMRYSERPELKGYFTESVL